MKIPDSLKDVALERSLLSGLLKSGKDGVIDCAGVVSEDHFYLPINKVIFKCVVSLLDDGIENFDKDAIQFKAKTLGLDSYFSEKTCQDYLDFLFVESPNSNNIRSFAEQVRKYHIIRDLYRRYHGAIGYLETIKGSEKLSEIISQAEQNVANFVNGFDDTLDLEKLADGIEDKIEIMMQSQPVDQVGIPTGFQIWDDAIGGGVRRGTVAVIGARSKIGKSFMAINQVVNIAKLGIPVLYLDTELTKEYQQSRMICAEAKCPLKSFETGKFQYNKLITQSVVESAKKLRNIPIHYKSVAGLDPSEALSIARRWITKHVGFNDNGKANDCVIVYDYFKLMDKAQLSRITPEYIVLGLMLTEIHNFTVKYEIPMIGYVQLNREGIDGQDTSIVAGSDRILWLCSSLSFLKNKDTEDADMGCGWEFGNKKLIPVATRHGPGLESDHDYINIHASINPRVHEDEACGYIKEGIKKSTALSRRQSNDVQSRPNIITTDPKPTVINDNGRNQ